MTERLFKALILDFDGVVADSEPVRLKTYETLFQEVFGLTLRVNVSEVIGYSQEENLQRFLKAFDLRGNVQELKARRREILMRAVQAGFPPVPSVHEITKALKKHGIPVAIASNSSREYVEGALTHFPLMRGIPVFSAEGTVRPKPDPQLFLKACEFLKVRPADCLVFEDTPIGLEAAKRAAMRVVGVLSQLREDQLPGADYYLMKHDPTQVNVILNLFGLS